MCRGSPSTCTGPCQLLPSRQCLSFHGVVVWGQALWCDSWLCLPICLTSSCLCQQTPGVSDHFFMVMAATIVCRPTHLDSISQPRADPWVYRTIFQAPRAHRQNLCCPVYPGVTSLFPVVSYRVVVPNRISIAPHSPYIIHMYRSFRETP